MASSTASQGVSYADSDAGVVLRNLATKQSMPGFDYDGTTFTFRTVFHTTPFSYCICRCAIALENLEFIDETGGINEDVFEEVVKCINIGECSHVKNVPRKYIQEARLYTLPVVAAVGGYIEKESNPGYDGHTYGGLLNRHLYEIAMARQGEQSSVVQGRGGHPDSLKIISHKHNSSSGGPGCVEIDSTEFISFCIERNYHQVLVDFINYSKWGLMGWWNIDRVLLTTFQQNCMELCMELTDLIVNDEELYDDNHRDAFRHCELAIIYNRPDVLGKLLGYVHFGNERAEKLYVFSEALERNQCRDILAEHGVTFKDLHVTRQRKVDLLVSLLVNGTVNFLDVIGPQLAFLTDGHVLEAINSTQHDDLEEFHWGLVEHGYCETMNESNIYDINYRVLERFSNEKTLQAWLDIGYGSMAGDDLWSISSYLDWLHGEISDDHAYENDNVHILSARRCLEVFLFANLDVTLNKDAVTLGIAVDKDFHSGEQKRHWFMPARYILDCKDYGMCGHDDFFALNMTVPFLIECGFPVTELLSEVMKQSEKSLPTEWYVYVQHAFNTPRTLKVSCRDTLRRQFVGRGIHRFIDAKGADILSYIKDFILLKPLLRCIPKELLEKLSKKFLE